MKGKRKIKKKGNKKRNFLIIIFTIIVFSSFIYYVYSDQLESVISPYPSEVYYDFESVEIGDFPSGWRGTLWDGTEVVKWRNEEESFGNVAEIMDRDGRGVELAYRFKKATKGVIEFDIYGESYEKFTVHICQTDAEYDPIDDIIINLGKDAKMIIRDGDGEYTKIKRFVKDQWYHFKIEFDMDSWDLWIDGDIIDNGVNFNHWHSPDYFCNLYFSTYIDNNKFYVDNVEITVIEAL